MGVDETPSKLETRKDTLQVVVESGATRAGNIAGIVAGAVRGVARELGSWATDLFEMREAARRADAQREAAASAGAAPPPGELPRSPE